MLQFVKLSVQPVWLTAKSQFQSTTSSCPSRTGLIKAFIAFLCFISLEKERKRHIFEFWTTDQTLLWQYSEDTLFEIASLVVGL